MFDARRWLARLSFSFFIIAALLLWQANKLRAVEPTPQWLMMIYVIAAAMSVVLGVAGVRARHALRQDDVDRDR